MKHTQGEGCRAGILCMKLGKWSPDKDKRPCKACKVIDGCPCVSERCICNYLLHNGMTTEEAVRYLEHGREMKRFIRNLTESAAFARKSPRIADRALELLTKMKQGGK